MAEPDRPASPPAPSGPAPSYPGLASALASAAADGAKRKARELVFSRAAYRLMLAGPLPDKLQIVPDALTIGTLAGAQDILRGCFSLPSGTIEVKTASPYDLKTESAAAAEMHRFEWLAHLEKAGGNTAAYVAKALVEDWLDRYQYFEPFAWRGDVLGPRLVSWAAYFRFLNADNDLVFRSRLLKSMAEQTRHLGRAARLTLPGLPRLEAAGALVTLQAVWRADAKAQDHASDALRQAVVDTVLPDGGIVSRSPREQMRALAAMLRAERALRDAELPQPAFLTPMLAAMQAALALLRHGDGRLAGFNGAAEAEAALLPELLDSAALDVPSAFAPDWRYARLAGGRSVVMFDAGAPPPGAFATEAHAAPLSFEFSHGDRRLIVNGGVARQRGASWIDAARRTAAHATLQIGEEDAGAVLAGRAHAALGARLYGGTASGALDAGDGGTWAEGSHDFYRARFGVMHERRLFLDASGEDLRGEDTLRRAFGRKGAGLPVIVRFPLHPDIRATLAQGGDSVLLAPPEGSAWRFRAAPLGDGALLALEPEIYMGGETVRNTQAIVVRAAAVEEVWTLRWAFKIEGPPARARRRVV